jgi:4-hydroxy-2-oxoheptanedioate aldolase
VRTNHARLRLQAGEPSVGTWLSLPSPEAAEFLGRLPFDWLTVDAEHNAVDIRTLAQMFSAISAAGTAPMVRIPWNTPETFKRVLDAGAWGIVVPMVNSREEAEQAVEATRYYPQGRRSVGGGRHALSFGTDSKTYYDHANENILLVLQIEHIEGVENIDEIMSVPGFDACFIGPNDLAASMGLGLGVPLESDIPELVDAIRTIRESAVAHGIAPGIHTSGPEGIRQRIDEGFQYLAMASEIRFMLSGLTSAIESTGWTPSNRSSIETGGGNETVRY